MVGNLTNVCMHDDKVTTSFLGSLFFPSLSLALREGKGRRGSLGMRLCWGGANEAIIISIKYKKSCRPAWVVCCRINCIFRVT